LAEKSELGDETPNSLESLLRRAPSSQVGLRSTLAVGSKLAVGRFEICGRIGEGGMGVVYERSTPNVVPGWRSRL
jgi:hypothetical protein